MLKRRKAHHRQAAIRVRPLDEAADTWLYFPFGAARGGPGWVAHGGEAARRLALMDGDGANFFLTPLALCAAMAGLLSGFDWLALLAGAALGGLLGVALWRWWRRSMAGALAGMEPAPWRLTPERYWQELASQHTRASIAGGLLFTALMTIALAASLLTGAGELFRHGGLFLLHLAGLVIVAQNWRYYARLLPAWRRAKAEGTVAGSLDGLEEC